jgi:hypothetical protein
MFPRKDLPLVFAPLTRISCLISIMALTSLKFLTLSLRLKKTLYYRCSQEIPLETATIPLKNNLAIRKQHLSNENKSRDSLVQAFLFSTHQ